MNNQGQMNIMIGLLFLVMTLMVLVALIPVINEMLNVVQQSDSLNCNGYRHNGDVNNTLSYNSSLATNTLACLAIRLYLPYIILVVLVGMVAKLLANKLTPDYAPGYNV